MMSEEATPRPWKRTIYGDIVGPNNESIFAGRMITMTDTVEPITRGERALGNVLLHQPCGGFSQLDIGPYKIGIAITTEDGEQDPEKAGEALEEFVRRAVASEAREKRLQAELDALNDNGALHTAYLSGQRDAKERIAALRASEERIKKLEEALRRISELDYAPTVGERWRRDGLPSKLDKCLHGQRVNEECESCVADFARQALGE